VRRVDAILLTGGSAFGLAAADGVVRYLSEQGRGFPTSIRPVPIVAAAVIYDLAVGRPETPDGAAGYAACLEARSPSDAARGAVGAGTGATFGTVAGPGQGIQGGFGVGRCDVPDGSVSAFVVVNAFGDVVDPRTGQPLSGRAAVSRDRREAIVAGATVKAQPGENTSLVVMVVDAACDHDALIRCSVAAHDGLARAIRPCHTLLDGDTVFAVTLKDEKPTGEPVLRVALAAEMAVERAVVDAVSTCAQRAKGAGGVVLLARAVLDSPGGAACASPESPRWWSCRSAPAGR
jgi:L-aminopeptidase/D-esterase-like protein